MGRLNNIIQCSLLAGVVAIGGASWIGIIKDEEPTISHFESSLKQAGIERDEVVRYQETFDVNDDFEHDYVVKLKDGSARIVHGYKPGQ